MQILYIYNLEKIGLFSNYHVLENIEKSIQDKKDFSLKLINYLKQEFPIEMNMKTIRIYDKEMDYFFLEIKEDLIKDEINLLEVDSKVYETNYKNDYYKNKKVIIPGFPKGEEKLLYSDGGLKMIMDII